MKTLLIADDSEAKLMLLQGLVHHAHWSGDVHIARTTEEAEAVIAGDAVDCAFIDYYIPSSNGPAIIRALKARHPDARCALVSSSDQRENIDEAMAAGAEAFVCTTWEADRVEKAIFELLEAWKTV